MEGDFNENFASDAGDDLSFAEQVCWKNNPLFCNNGDNNNAIAQELLKTNDRCEGLGKQCEVDHRRTIEFDTESGYSETISVLSELSSPAHSISSFVSLSDEENELIEEIADKMRQASIAQAAGKMLDGDLCGLKTAQILSSKGTVRGVKNRVRDNILQFFSSPQDDHTRNSTKSNATSKTDPDRGKVVIYTTSLGFVRATQYECKYVKRIFHNLMVRFDERDLFVHPHFKEELQKKLGKDIVKLPQIFIDGEPVGGAKDVEKMIESGTMKEALTNIERVSHAQSCSACGGYKFISCSKCSGSGKSRRTRFSREISSLKCSGCTNGIISCPDCNS